MEQPISSQSAVCKRGLGRAVLGIRSRLATSAEVLDVEIADLSLRGAGILVPRPLVAGQSVWLNIGPFKVFGEVRWCLGSSAGIAFEENLPKAVVLNLRGDVVEAEELAKAEARMAARNWVVGTGGERSRADRVAEVLGYGNGPGSGASSGIQDGKHGWFSLRRRRGESFPGLILRIVLPSILLGGLIGFFSAMIS